MTTQGSEGASAQAGLSALVMLLRLRGVGVDPAQLRHQLGTDRIDVPTMLRTARQLGLKAGETRTRWERLARTALPGIAVMRDGGFLVLGKVGDDKGLGPTTDSPCP